ncbi:hypothetical protein LCGC14_3115050 [marine sediment metagenome]|uniref:Uncharacterized protein n=1 Tax=marine sediment metagenome TaxID=412755 RepID=A0A0F8YTX3_9ZZZZ
MVEIGDWCITKNLDYGYEGRRGLWADHIKGCRSDNEPTELGDCCWAADDRKATCFYCGKPVPPEIQALVHLQTTL